MQPPNVHQLVNKLVEIRTETSALLPIGNSFIPYDILLIVLNANLSGQDLTVKSLFASLPYSLMGTRSHFNKLIKENWIELHNGDADSRIKRVKPSPKLTKIILELSNNLNL